MEIKGVFSMKTKKVWKEAKQIFDDFGLEMEKRERNKIDFTVTPSIFCPSVDGEDKLYQFSISFNKSFDSFVKEFCSYAKGFDSEKETSFKVSCESVEKTPTYHDIARWVKCYDGIKSLLLQISFNINEYLNDIAVEEV